MLFITFKAETGSFSRVRRVRILIRTSRIYSDFNDDDDGDGGKNPADAMKDALATGNVADLGKAGATKLVGGVTKGLGGFAGKALGSFF